MRARAGLLSKDHWAPLGIVAPYVIVRERSDRGNPFSPADDDIPHVTEGGRIATSGFAILAMTEKSRCNTIIIYLHSPLFTLKTKKMLDFFQKIH